MQISIEISLYPLAEQTYKSQIWDFIDNLNAVDGLNVVTNGMSTQVFGDYDLATTTVMAEIKKVHENLGAAVFVVKFIGGDRSHVEAKS
ncbi:hypothetical protein [Thalassotalea sp. PS06]|uniref:hypothetical protein n=1 Tax=Thalassotalea sp. PS06 TaxID=2594005 RepID=UPI001164DC6D|nr:hypothetical protein [Thalassotalea sp. PS06]QDP02751.1 hypothetical protein FNC98_16205 [Thalassotalea sp. PS06]